MYVANSNDNTVSVISGKTNTVVGSPISVGTSPFGIAFDPLNGHAYVTDQSDNAVTVIIPAVFGSSIPIHCVSNIRSNQHSSWQPYKVGSGPDGIAFDSTNNNLYVTNDNLYVTNIGSNTVSVISGSTNSVVGNPISVGSLPLYAPWWRSSFLGLKQAEGSCKNEPAVC